MRPAFCHGEPWRRSTKVDAACAAPNSFRYVMMSPRRPGRVARERTRAKTLYDLLGARPDDDAEGLRRAFRNAAKANHPDLHSGDPDAPARFRQITEAYKILRDPEQRAAYDHLLTLEQFQGRWNLKGTISYLMQDILSDAFAVVGLAVVLAGGYMLFAQLSNTPVAGWMGIATHGPDKIVAVQRAARTAVAEPDKLRDELLRAAAPAIASATDKLTSAAKDGGTLEVTKIAPDPGPTALQADIEGPDGDPARHTGQASAQAASGRPGRSDAIEPLDRDKAQSSAVKFSSLERDNGVPNSSPPDLTRSDDRHDNNKHDVKVSDAREPNVSEMRMPGVKTPEIKLPGRPRTVAKRRAPGRPFEQASLESRNSSACSGSCSRDVPPLFGVGF